MQSPPPLPPYSPLSPCECQAEWANTLPPWSCGLGNVQQGCTNCNLDQNGPWCKVVSGPCLMSVVTEGDQGREMYFLTRGMVEVLHVLPCAFVGARVCRSPAHAAAVEHKGTDSPLIQP